MYAGSLLCGGDPAYVDDLPVEVADSRIAAWGSVLSGDAGDCDVRRTVTLRIVGADGFVASAVARAMHMAVGGATVFTNPEGGRFLVAFSSVERAKAASELDGWTVYLADDPLRPRRLEVVRGPAGGPPPPRRPPPVSRFRQRRLGRDVEGERRGG